MTDLERPRTAIAARGGKSDIAMAMIQFRARNYGKSQAKAIYEAGLVREGWTIDRREAFTLFTRPMAEAHSTETL